MKKRLKMSRCEMQSEAMAIETLLNSAMAIYGSTDPEQAIDLVEMAQSRAERLNFALDSINAPEVSV